LNNEGDKKINVGMLEHYATAELAGKAAPAYFGQSYAKPNKPHQPKPGKPRQPKPGKSHQPKPGKPRQPKPCLPGKSRQPMTGNHPDALPIVPLPHPSPLAEGKVEHVEDEATNSVAV
jgi:hypothetical protein